MYYSECILVFFGELFGWTNTEELFGSMNVTFERSLEIFWLLTLAGH